MHAVPRKVWLGVYIYLATIILLGILSLPTGNAWFTMLVIAEHLILFMVYAVKVCRSFNEQRQCEIDNISLRKNNMELKQHAKTLVQNLESHAKFNSDVMKDVDVFVRATGLPHKTAAK